MYSTIPNNQFQSEQFIFKKTYGIKRNRTSFFTMMRSTIHSNSKGKENLDEIYYNFEKKYRLLRMWIIIYTGSI